MILIANYDRSTAPPPFPPKKEKKTERIAMKREQNV